MNDEQKTLLLLGGTGFVGRAIAEKYLKTGWKVIITAKDLNINNAKEKLINHGFDKTELQNFFNRNQLLFILGVDLCDLKWKILESWYEEFKKINIVPSEILRIMNFVTDTSGSRDEIIKVNIGVLERIFTIVGALKSINKKVISCNMGSVAERRLEKNLPPYELAKRIVRERIYKSGLCDYHFVAHYVKGKGEQKMKSAAPFLWSKLKISYKWFFSFKVSIIDVDDLADIIFHVVEKMQPLDKTIKEKPIEVEVTNGEMVFGEMIKHLLPENKRFIPKQLLPKFLENIFLKTYSFLIPILKPNNQIARRLAYFAKLGSMGINKQKKIRLFKTSEEIKKSACDFANYTLLEKEPNLIIMSKQSSEIFILKERSEEELKQVVQKALY